MDAISTLGLFAQLAVALTGFAGLLTAFRGGRKGWTPVEVAGIKILLMTSVAAMGFAALPVPMLAGGWDAERAVAVSSILLALHLTLAAVAGLQMVFSQRLRPRRPVLFWAFIVLIAPLAALLFLSGFGVVAAGGLGLYCAGLLLLLAIATAQFLFQVLASIAPAAPESGER